MSRKPVTPSDSDDEQAIESCRQRYALRQRTDSSDPFQIDPMPRDSQSPATRLLGSSLGAKVPLASDDDIHRLKERAARGELQDVSLLNWLGCTRQRDANELVDAVTRGISADKVPAREVIQWLSTVKEGRELASKLMERVVWEDGLSSVYYMMPKMDVRWGHDEINLESFVSQAIRDGVLDERANDWLVTFAKCSDSELWPPSLIVQQLFYDTDRAIGGDMEAGQIPCRHDLLLEDLLSLMPPEISVECPVETYNEGAPDEPIYHLEFLMVDRHYEHRFEHCGDYYAMEEIAKSLHFTLRTTKRKEKIYQWVDWHQSFLQILADERKVNRLVLDFSLPLQRC